MAALWALLGCGSSSEPSASASSSAPPSSSSAPAVAGAPVDVSLDGASIAKIAPSELGTRRPLGEWLPEAARPTTGWRTLEARSGKRTLKIRDVAERYPDQDVALFVDGAGAVAIGLFRRETAEMPAWMKAKLAEPTVSLDGVETIEVRTREREPEKSAAALELQVRGGEARPVTETELTQLATRGRRSGSGRGDGKGGGNPRKKQAAPLAELVALSTPLAEVEQVVASSPNGRLSIQGSELRTADFAGSIRRNRRGELVLRVGEARELRGVTAIEIVRVTPSR